MPYGMSWGHYGALVTASLASMLAGASAVHFYYRPDLVCKRRMALLRSSVSQTIPDAPVVAPPVTSKIAIVPPRGSSNA